MDDLASRLIEASQKSTNTDDIGIPNPPTPDQLPQFWEYLVARAFYFDYRSSSHIYTRSNFPGVLWRGHDPIPNPPTPGDIQSLTHYYQGLPERGRRYIYDRLVESAPRLDPNKICIAPGVLWDLEAQDFIQDKNITTITT